MRLRFSLRLLILLMAVVCIYLGARQWRKVQVRDLCEALRNDEYVFLAPAPNELIDTLWQRKPTVGNVYENNGEKTMRVIISRSGNQIFWSERDDQDEIAKLERLGVVEYCEGEMPTYFWRLERE